MPTPLTDTEQDMLRFCRLTWQYEGRREAAILERFDMSRTSFDLAVLRLIRTEAALAFDPLTVRRLRRIAKLDAPEHRSL